MWNISSQLHCSSKYLINHFQQWFSSLVVIRLLFIFFHKCSTFRVLNVSQYGEGGIVKIEKNPMYRNWKTGFTTILVWRMLQVGATMLILVTVQFINSKNIVILSWNSLVLIIETRATIVVATKFIKTRSVPFSKVLIR